MLLVNKVLAAGRVKPGQSEVVSRGARYATATASLGLELVSRGDVERAAEALRTVSLMRLFRVGYTRPLQLARLAQSLAPRAITSGNPAAALVAGLCSPRPLFSRAAEEPPASGQRPFESQQDLRRAGEVLGQLTLRIALVESLGVNALAMGQLPEPRPTLDDHLRTALARAMITGTWSAAALSQAELSELRRDAFADGKLTAPARRRAFDTAAPRLDEAGLAAHRAAATDVVDRLLTEIEGLLGGIAGDAVDARFVEGLLVEGTRS